VGSLTRQQASSHQLGGLWERSKLPSGVWGGAVAEIEIEFGAFYRKVWHPVTDID